MTGEVLYNGEKLTKKLKRNIGYVLQVRAQELNCFAESRRAKFVRPDFSLLQMSLLERPSKFGRNISASWASSCFLGCPLLHSLVFVSNVCLLSFLGRSSNIPLYGDFKRKRSF
jgi:hypothetical protein